ncbi:hypothetical protein [Sphingomonas sp.]|jgi:hypothetical protein|uniref:hypothetical protein n=1 Tax=Sphingomonas sp. TaxID=28214 RepID=UPI002E35BA5A|nr:hypothetical protein [Sphingomonas sp.]HEX4695055.1 hypothetical protein [Sphingomonas sp.]
MLSLALPLLLGTAAAPPPPSDADARCLAVFAYLAGTVTDPAGKQSAVTGVAFFVGKLKGVNENVGIEATLRRVYTSDANVVNADRARCIAELTAMGSELSAAGKSITANP